MTSNEAVVIKIEQNNIVKLLPMITDACSTCNHSCSKRGSTYSAINKKKLEIKTGSIVKVGMDSTLQSIQGIISLVIPIISAVLGYFCATPIAKLFKIKAGEGFHALLTLLFLFASAAIIAFIGRNLYKWLQPEIIQVNRY